MPVIRSFLFLLSAGSIFGDTLQPLGDEFGDAATYSRYQEHGALEGWGSSHIESADINTSSPSRTWLCTPQTKAVRYCFLSG